jgi:hypothetical protein
MYFGSYYRPVEEEELYRIATRSSSLRDVARELEMPWGTFHRYVSREENSGIRASIEEIISSNDERGIPEGYRIEDDHYVFEISSSDEPYRIHREVWEQVCSSYSRTGANMTKAQVAVEFNIPRAILDACLSKYGFYKSSPPYTHEDLLTTDDIEGLVDETLEQRQRRFQIRLQHKELDYLRREVERLWEEKYDRDKLIANALDGAIEGIREAGMAEVKPPRNRGGDRWVAHAPVADLHMAKFVWAQEDFGNDYDLPESVRRLVEHGSASGEWIQSRGGRCTDAYLTDVGDFIHSISGKTESGTILHQDSRNKKIFREAIQAKIRQVDAVRPYVDTVHVHAAAGNHAGYVDWIISEVLAIYYEGCPDVIVSGNVRPYDHFLIGESLIVLDHGKGINALTGWKAKASLDVVARQVAGNDYFKARRIYYFVGHLHELQAASHGDHAKLIRLPSFGESDEYESSLRYASEPVAHLYAHDTQGRIVGDEWIYFHASERP